MDGWMDGWTDELGALICFVCESERQNPRLAFFIFHAMCFPLPCSHFHSLPQPLAVPVDKAGPLFPCSNSTPVLRPLAQGDFCSYSSSVLSPSSRKNKGVFFWTTQRYKMEERQKKWPPLREGWLRWLCWWSGTFLSHDIFFVARPLCYLLYEWISTEKCVRACAHTNLGREGSHGEREDNLNWGHCKIVAWWHVTSVDGVTHTRTHSTGSLTAKVVFV